MALQSLECLPLPQIVIILDEILQNHQLGPMQKQALIVARDYLLNQALRPRPRRSTPIDAAEIAP
jgi:hypothetical protein